MLAISALLRAFAVVVMAISSEEPPLRNISWEINSCNRNTCCSICPALNLQIRAEATNNGTTDLIEVNLQPTPASNGFFIESFLCPSSPGCQIQSIFRAFVGELGEYPYAEAMANNFTRKMANVQLPTSNWTHTEVDGQLHFEAFNDDSSFRFYADVSLLGSTTVKWGFELTSIPWSGVDGETVLVLRASLGSKGTAARYTLQNNTLVLDGIDAVYGVNGMTWDPIVTVDNNSSNVSTAGTAIDLAYNDVAFIFGTGQHYSTLLWDPLVGGFTVAELTNPTTTTTTSASQATNSNQTTTSSQSTNSNSTTLSQSQSIATTNKASFTSPSYFATLFVPIVLMICSLAWPQ